MRKAGAIMAACVVAAAALSGNALAATFTVTKVEDTNDGVCDADCSLREAVRAANTSPGPDSIVLAAGHYQLSIAGRFEDAAAFGDLDVGEDLAVGGAGRDDTVLHGVVDRVFDVLPGAALTLVDLSLSSGNPSELISGIPFDLDAESGGALRNRGTLTLTDVDVRFSFAFRARGGGIFNTGTATLSRVEVASNQAGPGFFFGHADNKGGGIYNTGTLTLADSTIAGNTAFRTGGLYGESPGTATLVNSTVHSNQHIGIENHGGTLELEYSTVSQNTAFSIPGGPTAIVNNGTATVSSSILSSPATFLVCGGTLPVASGDHNVVSDLSCALTGPADQQGVDPMLKELGEYGGPTRTALIPSALLAASSQRRRRQRS